MQLILHVLTLLAAPANTLVVDVATYGASHPASGTLVLSPVGRLELSASDAWSAHLDWGLVVLSELGDEHGFSRLRVGNPALSARYHFAWLGGAWRVGPGASLPLARLDDDVIDRRRDRNTLAYASGVRGNRDLWLWAPERGSLLVPADATWQLGHGWVAGEIATALLIPMGGFFNQRYDVVVQAAASFAYSAPLAEVGMRWQVVMMATQPRDRVQWSMAPFAVVALGPTRVRLEAILPLGAPLAALSLWSLNAGIEVTL